MKTTIEIDKMIFYSYHGVLPQETKVGNKFQVSVKVEYPFEKALESDDLNDTLNYASLFELIKSEMAIPSQLLEHVAGRIINKTHSEFPLIKSIWIKITKLAPPIVGEMAGVSIEVEKDF